MRQQTYDMAGLLGGLIVALIVLVGASIALLAPEGTSAKVLIAVWLWALPVVAVCTGVGLGLAKLLGRMRGQS